MPWGRYKGMEVAAVPADYLEWVRDNLTIQGELAYEIDTLLRGGGGGEGGSAPNPSGEAAVSVALTAEKRSWTWWVRWTTGRLPKCLGTPGSWFGHLGRNEVGVGHCDGQ